MIRVTENFRKIQDLLDSTLAEAGRPPGSAKLLAVSKKKPPSAVLEAASAGQRDFGENFVQEGVEKIAAVARNDLTWHFIGHLQTNKTRVVAEHFDWVHTIDRAKTARRLSSQRPVGALPLNLCLQVNVDREAGKSGVMLEDLVALAEEVAALPAVRLRGLMCLPAIRDSFDAQRRPFALLREALQSLNERGLNLDTLSMGMSGDYAAAIHEGATIVRIGTALFGARD